MKSSKGESRDRYTIVPVCKCHASSVLSGYISVGCGTSGVLWPSVDVIWAEPVLKVVVRCAAEC